MSCHHDSGGHEHSAGPSHDGPDSGSQDNLFTCIDRPNVVALNAGEGVGPEVIKPWHERNDMNQFLVSDEDGEMIIRIPFTASINVHALLLKTGAAELTQFLYLFAVRHSSYPNEDNLDFDDIQHKRATQEFHVAQGNSSIGVYAVLRAKFRNISSITLFFRSEGTTEQTQIFYIGFLGSWQEHKRNAIITVYETQANLKDHEMIQGLDGMSSSPHT